MFFELFFHKKLQTLQNVLSYLIVDYENKMSLDTFNSPVIQKQKTIFQWKILVKLQLNDADDIESEERCMET